MSPEAKQDYLVQFMADMILVSKAAEAKKMGDGADFKRRVAFARNKLLMELLLQSVGKQALTDEAMHKVYDDAVKQMGQEQEVHARHILIRAAAGDEKASKEAEGKIKAIAARLKKGEDFAKLATELSEDPSGKANGGDLGYFTKEQMVPEFSDTAFKLDKGQVSEPVKTQFGWHVIKVEDKRMKALPKFEEVKPQIEQYVTRKAQAELVTSLRASAKIEKMYKTEEPGQAGRAGEEVTRSILSIQFVMAGLVPAISLRYALLPNGSGSPGPARRCPVMDADRCPPPSPPSPRNRCRNCRRSPA